MNNNVLIDSDVILDHFLDREPFSDHSTRVLALCENKKVNGFVTGLAIANIYYLLQKRNSSKSLLRGIRDLLNVLNVLVVDKKVITNAIDSEFADFEDALQNYSAENDGSISTIITRNIKVYKKSKLSILTPEQFLKTL